MKKIILVLALIVAGCANPIEPESQDVEQVVDRDVTETCDYMPDGCDGWLW